MRLRIDLHVHTIYSYDSTITLREAVKWCRLRGLNGFAITDHDTIEGLNHISDVDGCLIIPGLEVSARGGHVLALGVEESIPKGRSIAETVDLIREMGGASIIAHPYAPLKSWVDADELENVALDAVEVANSMQIPYNSMLRRNRRLAERLGLPETGGSDAHTPWIIGLAYTLIDAEEESLEAVLKAIREGRTEAEGRGLTPRERMRYLLQRLPIPRLHLI